MSLDDDIARLIEQEKRLVFSHFDLNMAWALGTTLRDLSLARGYPMVIDVSLRQQPLFYAALPGSNAGNPDWVRRKRNTVLFKDMSSYRAGREYARKGSSLTEETGMPLRDYATHGGGFPILLAGGVCIGAVVVSGIPERDDHNLAVEGLAMLLGVPYASIGLN